jgi:hypothetical protein
MKRRNFVQIALGSAILGSADPTESTGAFPAVSLLLDPSAGSAGEIAFETIRTALKDRRTPYEEIKRLEAARGDTVLVAGIAKESEIITDLSGKLRLELPSKQEELLIQHARLNGRKILCVCGADPLGLAYGLYDVADRIAWPAPGLPPLSDVQNLRESPAVRDRSLSIYSMQQAYFEKRLFDEKYWEKYLDNLVRNRFNNFSFLFAYESSGFLAPPYPWFFDLPEFPEVKAAGVDKTQQDHYLRALNRVIQMTHERGLKFTLGIWDHIYDGHSSYYTEGVWDHLPIVNGRRPRWPVEGLTDKNLVAYTPKALERFLELVPDLDAIQFRMHGESGLSKAGLRNFWTPVFRVMSQRKRPIRFDARAKEFPQDLIETALQMGVPLRLTTKFLAEQVGPPFHAMHVQRMDQFQSRFSYFDLLRYPQKYKLQWRHWTSGTTRVLLWGDLEYVRRFADATHLYDGDGYEVAEPLATKMASQPHDRPPVELLSPKYKYYDEEFQRYWPFFFAFGRIGYNPETSPEVWMKHFEIHYGKEAAPFVERALTSASGILPRIIGYSLPASKFPTTRGWPERQRWDDLPDYAMAEPSDTQLFASFQEEARNLLEGGVTAKIRPQRTSEWFANRSKEVLREVQQAEQRSGPGASKEFVSTMVDLRILARLAEYHSHRIHAGIQYALFQQGRDLAALDSAVACERQAFEAWKSLVNAAGDVYTDDLAMGLRETEKSNRPGADLSGHWRDELPKIKRGIENLEKQRAEFRPDYRQTVGNYVFDKRLVETGWQLLPRNRDFSLELPNGFYELRFVVEDDPAHSRDWGPMWIEVNGADRTDTFVMKAGNPAHRTVYSEVRDAKLHVMLANESTGEWNISKMSVTRVEPSIAHVPVWNIGSGENSILRATVGSESNIRSVQVYWSDSSERYTIREMDRKSPFQYEITIPAAECGHHSRYFLMATDDRNRTSIYPPGGRDQPITIEVRGRYDPPSFTHNPIRSARPGAPLRISAFAQAVSGLKWVRLRYRSVNQRQDYFTLEMSPTGGPNQYVAEIPAEHIPAEWDLMYFFEVMDKKGNGQIFPDAEKETPYVVVKLDRQSV